MPRSRSASAFEISAAGPVSVGEYPAGNGQAPPPSIGIAYRRATSAPSALSIAKVGISKTSGSAG
jgi:hypothetical protein